MCAITLCMSAGNKSSFKAVVMASITWVSPVLVQMLFMGMISLSIYATPIFLIMNGMINDFYWHWQIILVTGAGISAERTIAGYRKDQIQNA